MSKIRLELDALAVESFAAEAGEGATGTVQGHEQLTPACTHTQNDQQTCARRLSYHESCVVDCECTNARFRCLDHI